MKQELVDKYYPKDVVRDGKEAGQAAVEEVKTGSDGEAAAQ